MTPLVSIIMGSTSDLPVMEDAAKVLNELQIPFEINALSAHRTPDKVEEFAKSASKKGLKVIIAGESTGTVITDKAMGILKNDPRVYSIQTGTPFWHKSSSLERTLLMNTNGATMD